MSIGAPVICCRAGIGPSKMDGFVTTPPLACVVGCQEKPMELSHAISLLQPFSGPDLTRTLAKVEEAVQGVTPETCATALAIFRVQDEVLAAAGHMKRVAGQINVVIHALGILVCLPRLLEPGETVQYVSLGAGNTGRAFDLETNMRVAEFKFISWQGGPETIRQNALFKDFYLLAENATGKRKFLYVLGTEYPLKFFNSNRSLSSVMSRNVGLQEQFRTTFGERYRTVREYYDLRRNTVVIQDVSPWVAGLVDAGVEDTV
jgi:hypothetical protein